MKEKWFCQILSGTAFGSEEDEDMTPTPDYDYNNSTYDYYTYSKLPLHSWLLVSPFSQQQSWSFLKVIFNTIWERECTVIRHTKYGMKHNVAMEAGKHYDKL